VHSKHRKLYSPVLDGTGKCGHMKDGKQDVANDGMVYIFKDKINCRTCNVIYGIHCAICSTMVYVGETGVSIYERFQNHLSSVRRVTGDPVAEHFNIQDHNISMLKIVGIEKIKNRDIHYRKIRESFWIGKLNTFTATRTKPEYGDWGWSKGHWININITTSVIPSIVYTSNILLYNSFSNCINFIKFIYNVITYN
jgi:hypothetical protein